MALASLFLLQTLQAGSQELRAQTPTAAEVRRVEEAFAVFRSKEALLRELSAAKQNLVAMNSPAVRSRLLQVAGTTSEEKILYWASRALVETNTAEVAPILIGRMERSDAAVSPRIVELLGKVGGRGAVPVLIRTAQTAKNAKYRSAALKALAGTADHQAALTILKAFDDEDGYVRREAREALVQLASRPGYADAVARLVVGKLQKSSGKQAAVLVWLLGRIGGPVARSAVSSRLDSGEAAVLEAAVHAAGELRMKDDADRLLDIATDKSEPEHIRRLAVKALADVRATDEVPDIIPLLEDDNPELKKSAHSALRRLTGKKLPLSTSAWEISQASVEAEAEYAFEPEPEVETSPVTRPPAPDIQPIAAERGGVSVYVLLGAGAAVFALALFLTRVPLPLRRGGKAKKAKAAGRKARRSGPPKR